MLNPFPIQFLSLFAYFTLRVITGFILIKLGYKHTKSRLSLTQTFKAILGSKVGSIIFLINVIFEFGIGILLILGLYTQYASLSLIILSVLMLIFGRKINHITLPGRITYLLLFAIGCSLFITGAGVFAFDLPI